MQASSKHYNIVFVAGIASDAFYITMNHGAQTEAAAEGSSVQFTGSTAAWGPSYQVPFLNAAIAKHPDLIVIAPTDPDALQAPIAAAVRAGIPVVLVDTTLQDPSVAITSISTGNIQAGATAADALARLVGSQGGKVEGVDPVPGISVTDQRLQGFNQQLEGVSPNPQPWHNLRRQRLLGHCAGSQGALGAHPDLAGVFADDLTLAF